MNNYNPVIWFEIYVQDIKRAQQFYEQLLQIQMHPMTDPTDDGLQMVGFPSPNTMENMATGSSGSLVQMQGVESGANSTIVYFACEDCSVEESRVEVAGGHVHRPKMAIGEFGFISLVLDTEGNMIGLHSMK